MKLVLFTISIFMCSCVWTKDIKALGGKGAHRSTDGAVLVWNAEKSFYHGTVLAGVLATTGASAYASAAQEATARHVATEGTKQRALAETTQQVTVQAGADVVKSTNAGNNLLEVPGQIVTPKGY